MMQAPGKLLLAGEYTLLSHGNLGVVTTVDRYVLSTQHSHQQEQSSFLQSATTIIANEFGKHSSITNAIKTLSINSSELCSPQGVKLGLGSSAATIIVAIIHAASIAHQKLHKQTLAHLAHEAHYLAQDNVGSGADVAGIVYGGTTILRSNKNKPCDIEGTLSIPKTLPYLLIWSGHKANTVTLLNSVQQAATHQSQNYQKAITRLTMDTQKIIIGLQDTTTKHYEKLRIAIDDAAQSLKNLSSLVDADIWIPSYDDIVTIVSPFEGATKPLGAGGGDMVWTVFPTNKHRLQAKQALADAGFEVISATLGTGFISSL